MWYTNYIMCICKNTNKHTHSIEYKLQGKVASHQPISNLNPTRPGTRSHAAHATHATHARHATHATHATHARHTIHATHATHA